MYHKIKMGDFGVQGFHSSKKTLPQKAVKQVSEYIRKNFRKDIKLDDIADAVKYNKFYICRVFKSTTGQTVQNFILELRINNAKALLKRTAMPLTEIVYGCGFSSQAYFCNIFKRKTGKTPLQYRNSADE